MALASVAITSNLDLPAKRASAQFLKTVDEVLIDPTHFADGVRLTGLNAAWRPVDLSVDAAFSDASSLLSQAISVFNQDDDLSQEQWGALQQLCMAKALISAAYSQIFGMGFAERGRGEQHDR